jgi:hypothetical protein
LTGTTSSSRSPFLAASRAEFEHLDADAARIRRVRHRGIIGTHPDVVDFHAAFPQTCHRRLEILDVQAEVVQPRGTIGIRALQLDERVPAGLHVRERRLPLVVADGEPLAEAHLLGVEGERLVEVVDGDGDVIHVVGAVRPIALREARYDGRSGQEADEKHEQCTHRTLRSG